jgi:hypothetical protein
VIGTTPSLLQCCMTLGNQCHPRLQRVVLSPTPLQGSDRTRRQSLNYKGRAEKTDIGILIAPACLLRPTALFGKSRKDATQVPLTKSLDTTGIENSTGSQPHQDSHLAFLIFFNSNGFCFVVRCGGRAATMQITA